MNRQPSMQNQQVYSNSGQSSLSISQLNYSQALSSQTSQETRTILNTIRPKPYIMRRPTNSKDASTQTDKNIIETNSDMASPLILKLLTSITCMVEIFSKDMSKQNSTKRKETIYKAFENTFGVVHEKERDELDSSLEEGVLSDSCEGASVSQVLGKMIGKANQTDKKKQWKESFKKSESKKNSKGFRNK